MTSCPLVRRTFATLRKAELGFLGVRVMTCTQTPRRCGAPLSAGDFVLTTTLRRPLRTSWLIVGIPCFSVGSICRKSVLGGAEAVAPPASETKTRHLGWRAKLLKLAWRTASLRLLRPEGRHTLPHHSNPVDRIAAQRGFPRFAGEWD